MSSNPTLDLIEQTGKILSNLGITNGKQEIIWYLEYKQLLTLSQLYTNNIELTDIIEEQIQLFFSKRKPFQPFQYIINKCEFEITKSALFILFNILLLDDDPNL